MASYGGPTALTYIPPIVPMRKPIPKGMRFDVLKRDNFTCRYCGAQPPAVVLHLDHVKAVANGGLNERENLVTACLACNIGKGVKDAAAPMPDGKVYQPDSVKRPPVEFFWINIGAGVVGGARCVERQSSEYRSLCDDRNYSTHGSSCRGFSPYEATMYAVDILTQRWTTSSAYINYIDDLVLMTSLGHIPVGIAPHVMRALHAETVYRRCITRSRDYEEIADSVAQQACAVFAPVLDKFHRPYAEAKL